VKGAKPDRPKRSGSQQRKKLNMVTTGYDDAELAQLDAAASRAGLTRASFQRVQSLGTPPKTRSTRRAPVEKEMLAKALGQLGKVGGNLNQLARAANLDRTYRVEIMDATAEIRALLPLFMQALGRGK
jgi:hypothetical protein